MTMPAPADRAGNTRRPAATTTRSPALRWLFMRVSGAVLVVMVLAHLTVNLVVGDGINAIDFALVAGRYANPFWQLWSLLMLWLAMLHGALGLSTIVDDYAESPRTRIALRTLIAVATTATIALGTLVIFAFDPCPPTSDPATLPSFCPGVVGAR